MQFSALALGALVCGPFLFHDSHATGSRLASASDLRVPTESAQSQLLEVQSISQTDAELEPISLFIVSTVAASGSLYSLFKTNKAMELTKQQSAAADMLVKSYQEQTEDGCRMLSQLASSLESKRQDLTQLIDKTSEEQPLTKMCAQKSGMEEFEKALRENLQSQCKALSIPDASESVKLAWFRCIATAKAPASLTEKLCAMDSEGLSDALWRVESTAARLDGLIAGVCGGLPGFESAHTKNIDQYGSSIFERQSRESSTFIPGKFPLDAVGLVFSIIGTLDYSVELYDSAVNLNDGYGILSDLVEQNKRKQQAVLQKSFELYWLDVAWMRAVVLASLEARYQSASLPVPNHLRTLQRVDSPRNWQSPDATLSITEGSFWSCHENLKCLVPLDNHILADEDVGNQYPLGSPACFTHAGDLRMCESPDKSDLAKMVPIAMAPRTCFSTFFGGKTGSHMDLGYRRNAWILHFASDRYVDEKSRNPYNSNQCLATLHSLAESNSAEQTLRDKFIGVSNVASPDSAEDVSNVANPESPDSEDDVDFTDDVGGHVSHHVSYAFSGL